MRTRIIHFNFNTHPINRYQITVFEIRPKRGINRKYAYTSVTTASATRMIAAISKYTDYWPKTPVDIQLYLSGWDAIIHEPDPLEDFDVYDDPPWD